MLGAIFGQTDRSNEALNANKKASELMPDDSEAHSNLGATLKDLHRFEDAEVSLRKAIELEPHHVARGYG